MTTPQAETFTTPTGRLVWGSLYKPRTTDFDGNPLTIKSGPDAGKATQRYEFGLAIAKAPGETHWAYSELGKKIWAVGHAAFPGGQAQRPDFSWKVVDGDSKIPNKKGGIPCEKEGFPGHWVFTFSSTFAPRVYNANGTQQIVEEGAVKIGWFVQVAGSVQGNTGASPGVYLNHAMVALQGYGPEIYQGPDPSQAGFGAGPAPAGMSATPVGGMPTGAPAVPGAPAAPANPPIPGAPAPAATLPPAPNAPPIPGAPAPTAVVPHPTILQPPVAPPAAPAAPAAPPAPPAAPVVPAGPQMTAKAGGQSYAAFIAQGWTEAQMREHGYLI